MHDGLNIHQYREKQYHVCEALTISQTNTVSSDTTHLVSAEHTGSGITLNCGGFTGWTRQLCSITVNGFLHHFVIVRKRLRHFSLIEHPALWSCTLNFLHRTIFPLPTEVTVVQKCHKSRSCSLYTDHQPYWNEGIFITPLFRSIINWSFSQENGMKWWNITIFFYKRRRGWVADKTTNSP